MSRSRSGSPRVPSAWWVLVPGVLLALAGARAVTSEAERARSEARDTARVAAEHIARAFGTLVDEYVAPLPGPGQIAAIERVAETTRHLVRPFHLGPDGQSIEAEPIRQLGEQTQARDAAVAREALELASASDLDPGEAASLLAMAAEALTTPDERARLLVHAARLDASAGDDTAALDDVRRALEALPAPEEQPGDITPFVEAWDLVPDLVAGAAERGTDLSWMMGAMSWEARCAAADTPGRPQGTFARVLTHLELDDSGDWSPPEHDLVTLAEGRVTLARQTRVLRAGYELEAYVGGEIPAPTLDERVAEEVEAVRDELGAAATLRAPDGTVLIPRAGGETPEGSAAIVTVADVTGAASGWSVHASVPRPTGLPGSALILAIGVAGSLVVLALGAFVLVRAARHHARLAEERRSFLDHVAHEVRTPAASLLALSEELQHGHVDEDRLPTYHEHLARESRRLADLVEETLDLARLEGGRLVAKREPLDLREVVLAAVDSARAEPGRVDVDLPDGEVTVNADRTALRRAIRNLVDNALKHGAADEPVELRLAVEAGVAVLSVRDRGKGIPPGHVDRVFERFHRVPSATHEVKGVGLGLALVAEVAAAHDGTASAENAPGGGARFTLRLPLTPIEGDAS